MVAGQQGSGTTLDVKRCSITKDAPEQDCIVGNVFMGDQTYDYTKSDKSVIYLVNSQHNIYNCEKRNDDCKGCQLTIGEVKYDCTMSAANSIINIELQGGKKADDVLFGNASKGNVYGLKYHELDSTTNTFVGDEKPLNTGDNPSPQYYFTVYKALESTGSVRAYAIFDEKLPIKPMGYTMADWDEELKTKSPKYFIRNPDGSVDKELTDAKNFVPSQLNATDGSLIDFSNAARRKATLTGAAAGGALGGFSAYQGAKTEIQERWMTAMREYADSLTKFGCKTGGRYLSQYNEPVEIYDGKNK